MTMTDEQETALLRTFLMKQLLDSHFLRVKEEGGHVIVVPVLAEVRPNRSVHRVVCWRTRGRLRASLEHGLYMVNTDLAY